MKNTKTRHWWISDQFVWLSASS